MANQRIEIEIDDETVQDAMQVALVGALSEESKTKLITAALRQLTSKTESGRYSQKGPSPLEDIFAAQTQRLVAKVLAEEIADETSELRATLMAGIREALADWGQDQSALRTVVANALVASELFVRDNAY